jgi:hypothetical protein
MLFRSLRVTAVLFGALGCGESSPATSDASELDARVLDAAPDTALTPDAPPDAACTPPVTAAGPEVVLAAPFDTVYKVYDLGPIPGVPQPLGGTVVSSTDPNTLLVAGGSERSDGGIYQIGVTRDACGHIIGWNGTATMLASTPYVDANLVYASPDLLLYTEYPQYHLSQLRAGSTTADRRTDLRTVGLTTSYSAGGVGFVPAGLAAAGQLRLLTWPVGDWYHATTAPDGELLAITAVEATTSLPNGPGGFAYVPAGSPGFTAQSLIVAEWSNNQVAVYDVDAQGDPQVATRREFFTTFPRPWAAYFEPVTGDYFFLSWGTSEDHVYVVQGFATPPPIL